jgi:hypothetical protein
MAEMMPRNPSAQPACAQRAAPRGLGRLLLLLFTVLALLAAEPATPARPEGASPVDAVAMALELALLARGDWDEAPGSLEEARALLGRPDAPAGTIRDLALEAAGSWSGRSEPARRLFAAWSRMEQGDQRLAMLEERGAVGELARLDVVAGFCEVLEGSTHLPPAQSTGLLAAAVGGRDAVAALGLVGGAADALEPRTIMGRHRLHAWHALLAEARLPGDITAGDTPRALGQAPQQPLAPLVRVEPTLVTLSAAALYSWRDGGLVVDGGPAPEPLGRWSPDAWQRWQVIARHRSELALGGVGVMAPVGAHRDDAPLTPNLLVRGDLPVQRLAEVMGWLEQQGVGQLCLLVRAAEHEPTRAVCAPFRGRVPDGGVAWSLGSGGLYSDGLPGGGGDAWALAEPEAVVDDLLLVLEEARHAGRSLGLAGGR